MGLADNLAKAADEELDKQKAKQAQQQQKDNIEKANDSTETGNPADGSS